LKISSENRYIADFLWFVTATPYDMLFSKRVKKYDLIIPTDVDTFNQIIIKNPDEYVMKSFKMPETVISLYNCHNFVYEVIKGKVRHLVQELAAANNIVGMIEALSGNKRGYESVINILVDRKLRKLKEIERMIEVKVGSESLLERKKSLELDVEKLLSSFKEVLDNTDCSICLEGVDDPVLLSCCQNVFCASCVTAHIYHDESRPSNCPLCRMAVTIKNVIPIDYARSRENTASGGKIVRYISKQHAILDILKSGKDDNKKYIIYSDYSGTFDVLRPILDYEKIRYAELKGIKSSKERLLEQFKTGDINVLLLTTLQYSAGLELTNTTDIILYHEMGENIKSQISGRANRIGRKIPLKIHQLI
jgi:SNF2 family DNA or RNA helicase